MSNHYKRGFHVDKSGETLRKSLLEGQLNKFLKCVNKNPDLTFQIRDNYFNIYYWGGNIARVYSDKRIEIDRNYFRKHSKKEDKNQLEIIEKENHCLQLFKEGKYEAYIAYISAAMKYYWQNILNGKGVEEKKAQHLLCLRNQYKLSDYTIIDLEYQVSKRSEFKYCGNKRTPAGKIPSPRFDIIAIRNSDHCLCIIELKKGTKALKGTSGLKDHAHSYAYSIGANTKTEEAFTKEMNEVVEQKKQLGLLHKDIKIDCSHKPEFIFCYQFKEDGTSFEDQKKVFRKEQKGEAKGIRVIWLNKEEYQLYDR